MDPEISVQQLQALKANQPDTPAGSFCLLDIREPWEFETASLPDSVLIPLGELPDRAHEELDPKAHIIVYCHNGRRSLVAVMWLREEGFPQTQSLAGGLEVWSQQIDPSVPRY